jgi:hypothetical protein
MQRSAIDDLPYPRASRRDDQGTPTGVLPFSHTPYSCPGPTSFNPFPYAFITLSRTLVLSRFNPPRKLKCDLHRAIINSSVCKPPCASGVTAARKRFKKGALCDSAVDWLQPRALQGGALPEDAVLPAGGESVLGRCRFGVRLSGVKS